MAHPETRVPNRLARSTSPYLLQHAYNPVDWHPWGEEALAKARREDKPIFLSIGYSACHWCHVMEHESFENEEIARVLNERFVPIKVDREERPDLDDVYMTAVQLMQGQGGWPLSVFLTPDLKPFFGGTYFPPDERWGRPGFRTVLERVDEAYRAHRVELDESAQRVAEAIARMAQAEGASDPRLEWSDLAVRAMRARFDEAHGGFGGAPKFPPTMGLMLLMRVGARTGDRTLRHMVESTLDHMAAGGMYDHLGGGFARYSTDAAWHVPHFEKMLYDQALLVRTYVEAWQLTGSPLGERVTRATLDFVLRELAAPDGGFCSALDADSEGEEGRFYAWTRAEVDDVLGGEAAREFAALYDVTPAGNWEHGRSVLRLTPEDARRLSDPHEAVFRDRVDGMRAQLLRTRDRRVRPGRDDKVVASWNGLMISALARAGAALASDRYIDAARGAADFLLRRLRPAGTLLHSYNLERAELPGFLDDVAHLAVGLLDLLEATGEMRWLDAALALADEMEMRFRDPDSGAYLFSDASHATPLARSRGGEDGATPGGNSTAAEVQLRLGQLTGDEKRVARARAVLAAHAEAVERSPAAFHYLLGVTERALADPREIVVCGPASDAATLALHRTAWRAFEPNALRLTVDPAAGEGAALAPRIPVLEGKRPARPTAYVCSGFTCKAPVTESAALAAQLVSGALEAD